jgi:hypothetical protein
LELRRMQRIPPGRRGSVLSRPVWAATAASRTCHIITGGSVLAGKRQWISSRHGRHQFPAPTHPAGELQMRQIRLSKRRYQARSRLEPLPLDARDPDIVRAKQLARHACPSQGRSARTQALPSATEGADARSDAHVPSPAYGRERRRSLSVRSPAMTGDRRPSDAGMSAVYCPARPAGRWQGSSGSLYQR